MHVLFLIIKIFYFPRDAHPRSIIRVREIYNLCLGWCNPCRVDRSLSSPLVRFTVLIHVCMHCTAPGTTPHDFSRLISYLRQIDVWVLHTYTYTQVSWWHIFLEMRLFQNANLNLNSFERGLAKDDQEIGN